MRFDQLKPTAEALLHDNILGFWAREMMDPQGGFYGQMTGRGTLLPDAPRGAVLNARILWAFSAAYRVTARPCYLRLATHARDYLLSRFVDSTYGGVFWSVDASGRPLDTKKQTYAQGFAIYGLSEYARATGDATALSAAQELFRMVEAHCYDAQHGGYHEALRRDWSRLDDMRLSAKDENADKTMNTHLHVVEPYTNLLRVWPDALLRRRIEELVGVFAHRLLNPQTGHLDLFFSEDWAGRRDIESYGHDIEASWLLCETFDVLDRPAALDFVPALAQRLGRASEEGLRADGSMVGEHFVAEGRTVGEREWWVQAECVVGELNLARLAAHDTAEAARHRQLALDAMQFVVDHLVCHEGGEWYWGAGPDGTPNVEGDRAGFWKCPYHNARMCLEIIERI